MSRPTITYITHFEWTIKHVAAVASPTSSNSALFSDSFLINGTSATVSLIFVHTNPSDRNYCSLFLKETVADERAPGQATYKFWIEGQNYQAVEQQSERKFDIRRVGMAGIGKFVRRSQVYSPSSFIQDDTLIIRCIVKYTISSSKRGEDIKEVLSKETISGCTLECNRLHYYVPRRYLIRRSSYFKRLLEGNTVESRTGIIHLENMSNNALKKFAFFHVST